MSLSNWFSADLCTNNTNDHDVFLSFRGPDSRSFANLLHSALYKVGIRTFLDSKSLEKGDYIPSSLVQGIQSSRICIPIFCKNFAGSKWCLKEEWFMEKCRKRIIPLFNDVSPLEVLNPDGGIYAKDLEHHKRQKAFSPEDIIELKRTLQCVIYLPGWSQYNQISGEEIVIKISLSEKVRLDIPKCFGLDWRAEHLLRLLNATDRQKQTVKVGIDGMGGMGKTTLAKVVYRQLLYSRFEYHCIILCVGERCDGENGLVNLQTQMVKDVSTFRSEVGHVDRGKALLQNFLKGKKIILLLDDIQSSEQLEALGGNYTDFGSGSCLLITSQNQQILKLANVEKMLEVKATRVRYLRYEPKERKTNKPGMFTQLYNLRLLWLANVEIKGQFPDACYFDELRWLRLARCSLTRLPPGMNLNKLVILEVTDTQITHLWDEKTEEHQNIRPERPKVLILRGCVSLEKLPAATIYTHLQIIDLHNCHSLRSLPNT